MNYTERINKMAMRPRDVDAEADPFITLMAMMAATLANAADHGHVTTAVHHELEQLIANTETQMRMY